MNTYINYFIESNLGLILFLVFYKLLLTNETNFNFKRGYLLLSLLASLIFPLLRFGISNKRSNARYLIAAD